MPQRLQGRCTAPPGLRLRFVDLNHDDVRRVPLKSRYTTMEAIWLPVELLQSDYIVSMPKLKTHHFAGLTASMKNLFGTVPGSVATTCCTVGRWVRSISAHACCSSERTWISKRACSGMPASFSAPKPQT